MFNFQNNKIIGVIHLLPGPGFKGYPGKKRILARALEDLKILKSGKVDAVIIENNYDLPHVINVSQESYRLFSYILTNLREKTNLPLGLSILWNDYKTALDLAKKYKCEFIRVPVFVDHVKTDFGEIIGEAEKVIAYRKKIKAEKVCILTDIQVKHAEILNTRPIEESAKEAILRGSDGLIVTGRWTGDAPLLEELKKVRSVSENIPLLVGSGANQGNVSSLLKIADSIIASTSLKQGENKSASEERNIKNFNAKISLKKLRYFVDIVKSID